MEIVSALLYLAMALPDISANVFLYVARNK